MEVRIESMICVWDDAIPTMFLEFVNLLTLTTSEGELRKVRSRETCFPCTASTFNLKIDSHHGGTLDSPVGKPRGKASWEASRESHISLYAHKGKRDTAAIAGEEIARACPHWRRGLPPLGRLQKYPKIHVSTGEESSGSGTDST